jgi:predicted metal-dependent phosphoesterase TrpH
MIDLHSHTDESDGSSSPAQLIDAAEAAGLQTLAITDHDTFEGFEKAAPLAQGRSLELIRGIELNTRYADRSIHLLAYFRKSDPAASFVSWLRHLVESRRDRNRSLAAKLRRLGFDIQLEEVEALGRSLAGRPHFARLLVDKGYAASREEAFDKYIGETGRAFVERDSPTLEEAIQMVTDAGGVASLAHPIRIGKRDAGEEEGFIGGLRELGLPAIEVYHSDHSAADIERYRTIAEKYGFAATGGSDFHGSYKPRVRLGYAANGTIPIPDWLLEALPAR